ncbi:unnamed protein product [Durusdinium trenchii]|uniref:C2H2-type domain-containing protein n=1 Tax=Durusdinium trenchii TaxID=1381693 RepID=A0ABP0HZX7_9DINO
MGGDARTPGWSLRAPRPYKRLKVVKSAPTRLHFIHGAFLAVGSNDFSVEIFDLKTLLPGRKKMLPSLVLPVESQVVDFLELPGLAWAVAGLHQVQFFGAQATANRAGNELASFNEGVVAFSKWFCRHVAVGGMPGARKTVKPKPCLGPYDDAGLTDTGTGLMEAFARRLKPISWKHDVHQHASQLIGQMHEAAEKVLSKRKQFHSKPFFSDEARAAILQKQMWRARMLQGRRELRCFWLSFIFQVWQKRVCPRGWLKVKDDILVQLHWGQGVFQWCFTAMRNWATTLARRDAQHFWELLASRLPEAEDNKDPREWWRLVQQHLPKTKARNDALAAERNERLQGQWRPYLCALEAGAAEFRRRLLAQPVLFGHRDLQLGASYKHLGTFIDSAGDLGRDIKLRIAQVATKKEPKVWSDSTILHQTGQPCLRVKLAVARLLFAPRVWKHAPGLVKDGLQREHELREDCWLQAFSYDLGWMQDYVDLQPWGTTWWELCPVWSSGKPGWKRLVKQALKKYIEVRRIVEHAFASEPQQPDRALEESFECQCGAKFRSEKALHMHQVHAHNERAPEHMLLSHPVCPVCLRFFWSLSRAQGHLRYVSRKGIPNRCYEWLCATSFLDDRIWDGKDFSDLPGMKRKEALRLQGPQPCGAMETDLEAIESDFLDSRQQLKSGGIFFPVSDEMKNRCFVQFDWEFSQASVAKTVIFPQVEGVTPGCTAAAFFLWGMKQDLKSDEFRWFEQVLQQHPQGELLAHLPPYLGPANDRERNVRDLSIPSCDALLVGSVYVPVKRLPLSVLCKL